MSIFNREEKDSVPNKFTKAMGKLIKKAREEAGLSQEALGKSIHRRRETISVIENGKSEVGSILLALIAHATDKPITYFYPPSLKIELKEEKLNDEDTELLLQFRRIWDPKNRQIILNQIRAMAEFDTNEYLEDQRKAEEEALEKNKDKPLPKTKRDLNDLFDRDDVEKYSKE